MKEIDFEAIRQTAFENCTKHFDDDDLSKASSLRSSQKKSSSITIDRFLQASKHFC